MKIGAIKGYYKFNSKNTFKGLWAQTTKTSDYEGVLSLLKVTRTSYYHPFKNESANEINQVVNDNTKAYIEDNNNNARYIIHECKICTTLPFTQEQFTNYLNSGFDTRLTPTNKLINRYVQNLYINNGESTEQTPAVNIAVNNKIKFK